MTVQGGFFAAILALCFPVEALLLFKLSQRTLAA
jgi:hypothetical protein